MDLPKISIVIISYNQGQYLDKCIRSVINQSYSKKEIILIDGGSNDQSLEIIKSYESHFSYWISEKDNGQSEAIQKGIKRATGEIFNWICSDDYLEPYSLEHIGHQFKINPHTNIVSGYVREFNSSGTLNTIKKGTQIRENVTKTLTQTFVTQPSTFWKTSIIREFGITQELHYYMDYELWFKYLLKYGLNGITLINDLIAHYLFHPQSKSQIEADYTQTKKDSKFKIDMNSIFVEFANLNNFKNSIKIIRQLSSEIVHDYRLQLNFKVSEELAKTVVNQYIFENAKRYYWQGDYSFSKKLFTAVDYSILDKVDQKVFEELYFRSKWNPILNIIKKILRIKSLNTF